MEFGAINKNNLHYILPVNAIKSDDYKCPDCEKDLILCKGKIKKPYFRHKVDKKDPCRYYTNPNETQIHKEAKLRLKRLIETKNIKINRFCNCCKKTNKYIIPDLCDKSNICIEHRFQHNGTNKSADLVYLKDGEIFNIYEICHTHKTQEENRPEPWFDFDATNIIDISKSEDADLEINCIREKKCDHCIYMDDLKDNNLEKWIRIKLGQDYDNPNFDSEERPIHERICVGACIRGGDDDIYKDNKTICDLFIDDLNTNRIVLYVWKGDAQGYIVSKEDFSRFNYWNKKYWSDGFNEVLDLPYLYIKHYGGGYHGSGTVNILKDLIINSLKITPMNVCKYTETISDFSNVSNIMDYKKIKKRNELRIVYYEYLNRNNPNIINVPYEYIGNIEEYHKLVKKYVITYIENYENSENTILYHKYPDYYKIYKNVLLNIHNYCCDGWRGREDDMKKKYWNKNIIELDNLKRIIKKDDLINPITMRKNIIEMFKEKKCNMCKDKDYCVCHLNTLDLEILNQDMCLVCKGNSNIDCYYCKRVWS